MTILRLILVIVALLPFNIANAQDMVKSFGTMPELASMKLSPDGSALAAITHKGNDAVLAIYDLTDSSNKVFVGLDEGNTGELWWGSDNWIIVEVSVPETVNTDLGKKLYNISRYVTVSRDGKKTGRLLSKGGYGSWTGSGRILSLLPDDPANVLIQFQHMVFKASLEKGSADVAETGLASERSNNKSRIDTRPITTDYYVAGPGGEVYIRSDYYDNSDARLFGFKPRGGKSFSEILKIGEEDGEGSSFLAMGMFDENTIAGFARIESDMIGLYSLDPDTGDLTLLEQREQYDIEDVIIDPYRDTVVGYTYTDDLSRQVFTDKALQGLLAQLKDLFAGENVRIASWSANRRKFVLEVEKPGMPMSYFLLDVEAGSTAELGNTYPQLQSFALGARQKFDYTASDGLVIPGYLTLPPSGGANLPLVVMPHGGPLLVRDDQSFDWWAQYFAALGYAVYQPNFRGSTGYGGDFEKSAYGERGGKMQSDIHEGVRALIANGSVNKDRICIVGASYGGYAALWAAAFESGLYKCAASFAGVASMSEFFTHVANRTGGKGSESVEHLNLTVGNRTDTSFLKSISPSEAASQITIPVLLIHGEKDTVVPYGQTRVMMKALQAAGKDPKVVSISDEDHWPMSTGTRELILRETGAFVEAAIGQ